MVKTRGGLAGVDLILPHQINLCKLSVTWHVKDKRVMLIHAAATSKDRKKKKNLLCALVEMSPKGM